MMIFSKKFKHAPTKIETMILLTVFSHDRVPVLPSRWWFFIVGRKETSIASHQKNKVAGTSRALPRSLHFLLLLVKRLDMRPMGHGMDFARS
jgi:hypothetical protein